VSWALDPMNAGFFEVEPRVISGIETAFQTVRRFLPQLAQDMADSEPLQKSPDAQVWFAKIVAGEMGKAAALFPVRWLPAKLAYQMDLQIGRALGELSRMVYNKSTETVVYKKPSGVGGL